MTTTTTTATETKITRSKTTWTDEGAGVLTATLLIGETAIGMRIEPTEGNRFKALVNDSLVATRNSVPRAQNSARYYATHLDQIKSVTPRAPKAALTDVPVIQGPTPKVDLPPAPPAPTATKIRVAIPGVASDHISWSKFENLEREWETKGSGRTLILNGTTAELVEMHEYLESSVLPDITSSEFGLKAGDIRKSIKIALERLSEMINGGEAESPADENEGLGD